MFRTIIICDLCGKELPIEQITTQFGIIEVVKTGKTKVWDTSSPSHHLCKECALRIDNELLKLKLDLLESTK